MNHLYFLPFMVLVTIAGLIALVALYEEFILSLLRWSHVPKGYKRTLFFALVLGICFVALGLIGDFAAAYGWGIFQ